MSKRELAIENFKSGYNCAQSVLLAYQKEIGLDKDLLLKMASPFGAGIASLRDVCGAVSGMVMAFGFLYGYNQPNDIKVKTAVYDKARSLVEEFRNVFGSYVCKDLLVQAEQTIKPHERDANYYAKRKSCIDCVGLAAEILEKYINNNPINE